MKAIEELGGDKYRLFLAMLVDYTQEVNKVGASLVLEESGDEGFIITLFYETIPLAKGEVNLVPLKNNPCDYEDKRWILEAFNRVQIEFLTKRLQCATEENARLKVNLAMLKEGRNRTKKEDAPQGTSMDFFPLGNATE